MSFFRSPSIVFERRLSAQAARARSVRRGGRVRIGVVSADDDDGVELHFFSGRHGSGDLIGGFDFRASAADDVEASGVAVLVHELVFDFNIGAFDQTGGSAEESEELGFRVALFQAVVDSRDNIVSARSLSSREDNAYPKFFSGIRVLALLEIHHRLAVGVFEEFLQLSLILSSWWAFRFDRDLFEFRRKNGGRSFGALIARSLQCGQFHGYLL